MKKYLSLTAAALVIASTAAVAQNSDRKDGANAPSASPQGGSTNVPRGKDNAPSAKENAPGQMKGDGASAKDNAPGQMKGDRESAKDDAPGNKKDSKSSASDNTPAQKNSDTKNAGDKTRDDSSSKGASDGSAGSSDKGQGKNLAEMPAEKKTQVRSAFGKHRVEPARDLNITINVGVSVPRSVRLYSVPQDIIVIYPAYSNYRYFYIDDRICIVDPVTFEIVEVIIIA